MTVPQAWHRGTRSGPGAVRVVTDPRGPTLRERVRKITRQRRNEAARLEAPLRPNQRWDTFYQPDAALTWADVLPDDEPTPEDTV